MNTRNYLEEQDNAPTVCIYPKWRFKNQSTHNLIMFGFVTSLYLTVFPSIFLFDPKLAELLNDDFKKYCLITLGVGISGAIATGTTFFCCTKSNKARDDAVGVFADNEKREGREKKNK